MEEERTERPGTGSLAAAVSNQLVRLLSEHIGRGPSRARAIVGRDHILVVFSETLTREERTLLAAGRRDLVLQVREAIYEAIRADAIRTVEELAGRPVLCALSDSETDPDLAMTLFLFATKEAPEPSLTGPCPPPDG